jgi:tRNA G18 (ribose-2'-O)-methylase SpoU
MTQRNFKEMIKADQANVDSQLNVRDEYQSWPVHEIRELAESQALPYGVCLLSLTGDLNVGTIIRTSHLFGAERVMILGRRKYDRRSTVGAEFYTPVEKLGGLRDDDTLDPTVFTEAMNAHGYVPVFIEQGGMQIREVDWQELVQRLWEQGKKMCFVFGNEGRGIDANILATRLQWSYSMVASVPQYGVMRSLNVAATASIVLYDAVTIADAFLANPVE